jgi:hypothetical protein
LNHFWKFASEPRNLHHHQNSIGADADFLEQVRISWWECMFSLPLIFFHSYPFARASKKLIFGIFFDFFMSEDRSSAVQARDLTPKVARTE